MRVTALTPACRPKQYIPHDKILTVILGVPRVVAVAVVVVVECGRGPQRQELEREQREDGRIQPTVVQHILADAHAAVGRKAERVWLREDPAEEQREGCLQSCVDRVDVERRDGAWRAVWWRL